MKWFDNAIHEVPVTSAGAADGLAAGIFQVNFVAPEQSSTNVGLNMGNNFTQLSVWVE